MSTKMLLFWLSTVVIFLALFFFEWDLFLSLFP